MPLHISKHLNTDTKPVPRPFLEDLNLHLAWLSLSIYFSTTLIFVDFIQSKTEQQEILDNSIFREKK